MRTIGLALLLALVAPFSANAQEDTAAATEVTSTPRHHSDTEHKFGFELRLKAAVGVHARDIVDGRRFLDSGDVGIMIEPFHFYRANLNAFSSFRSVGIGLGHDVTPHFGLAILANTPWQKWRPTPFLSAYFVF